MNHCIFEEAAKAPKDRHKRIDENILEKTLKEHIKQDTIYIMIGYDVKWDQTAVLACDGKTLIGLWLKKENDALAKCGDIIKDLFKKNSYEVYIGALADNRICRYYQKGGKDFKLNEFIPLEHKEKYIKILKDNCPEVK
jgi:hypothetical protein